jgi:hypothetical protein
MADLGGEVTRGVPRIACEGGTPALQRPSAAYEVDDFQLIAFRQLGFGPLLARDDISVQLDGYAVLFHAQLFNQLGQGSGGEVLFLAVDNQLHLRSIFASYAGEGKHQPRGLALGFYFSQLELSGGGAAGIAGLHQDGGIRQ